MAKRGRKPKERKGYFYEQEENAIIRYLNETNAVVREQIFNNTIYPAFTKMIESIIRRYRLYVPDEMFEETFSDAISYIMTKIDNFRPHITSYDEIEYRDDVEYAVLEESEYREKQKNALPDDPEFIKVYLGVPRKNREPVVRYCQKVEHDYKAYSYCGTICKHYLIQKNIQYVKERARYSPYDVVADTFENDERYSFEMEYKEENPNPLLKIVSAEIKKMVDEPVKNDLNKNEVRVGIALLDLFSRWEDIMEEGSNKLQKSSILYFLREETMMSTKELRSNLKKFKYVYQFIKDSQPKDE